MRMPFWHWWCFTLAFCHMLSKRLRNSDAHPDIFGYVTHATGSPASALFHALRNPECTRAPRPPEDGQKKKKRAKRRKAHQTRSPPPKKNARMAEEVLAMALLRCLRPADVVLMGCLLALRGAAELRQSLHWLKIDEYWELSGGIGFLPFFSLVHTILILQLAPSCSDHNGKNFWEMCQITLRCMSLVW